MKARILFNTVERDADGLVLSIKSVIIEDEISFNDMLMDIHSSGGILLGNKLVPFHQIILIEEIAEENESTESP